MRIFYDRIMYIKQSVFKTIRSLRTDGLRTELNKKIGNDCLTRIPLPFRSMHFAIRIRYLAKAEQSLRSDICRTNLFK